MIINFSDYNGYHNSMEIREHDNTYIITPLSDKLDARESFRLSKEVLAENKRISLDLSQVHDCTIEFIEALKEIAKTKEIGILRSLGARKKDISRVFNAETAIIGFTSGLMGVGIAYLLTFPINVVIKNATNLDSVARLSIYHAVLMIIISIVITVIGGLIPAKMASKKDPVEALRTE